MNQPVRIYKRLTKNVPFTYEYKWVESKKKPNILSKFSWWFLKKYKYLVNDKGDIECVTYELCVSDQKKITHRIMDYINKVRIQADMWNDEMVVLVGRDVWMDILHEGDLGTFSYKDTMKMYDNGYARVANFTVQIVPWMDGIVPVPKKIVAKGT